MKLETVVKLIKDKTNIIVKTANSVTADKVIYDFTLE